MIKIVKENTSMWWHKVRKVANILEVVIVSYGYPVGSE